MKTNFRRSVSAAVILTPAALLAACSTSEGWKSTKSDSTNSRNTGYSSDSRADGYYTATDRTHTTADGRRVTTRYYSNDPYGDGVSGGPGTNATMTNDGRAVSYDTRTNERNNPNWRDGPTRYDNENPSQDNSSSQYNTGISRNQSPAEGTVNNQNLAKGSVQSQNSQGWYENRGTRIDSTDTRWQNEQRMNQQNQQNQQSNPNWQANNQQWNTQQQNAQQQGNQQSGQQNQDWANRNQNSTGMNQGSNQNWNQSNQSTNPNWNQNNQQLPPRDAQGNWIQRNLDTSNMTTQDQQAAARQMSNPATNPSNSNAQFNQDSQYSTTQGNQQQNWQSGQQNQTGSNRDQNWNQGNQNTNPNWNNNQASNSNWNQNNQNSNQNSNQGWNQNNQQRDAQGNWIQRNLDTTNMTTQDQQAAARQMSDPATNPTNSNAQFNQNNSGQYATNQSNQDYSNRTYPVQSGNQNQSLNQNQNPNQNPNRNYANQTTTTSTPNNGVERVGPQNNWGTDGAHTDNTNISSGSQANRTNQANSNQSNSNQANTNQPNSSRSTDVNAAGQSQVFASSATADQKILSLLHFKNQKEIELGRLAASQGSSAAVKDYGNMLVREHTAADARVMAVASQTGTALMSDAETQNMIRAEKAAMGKDGTADKNADRTNDDRAKMADGTKEMKDPIEELRGLKGAEFDRVFAQNMVKGHQKLIAAIQKAQPQVKNEQTRQLLNEMIPTLQMHERTARQLPGFTETANAR